MQGRSTHVTPNERQHANPLAPLGRGLGRGADINMDCRVASAPRNDTERVGLPTSQNTFTPDAQLARSPRPIGERAEFVSELCELRNSGEGLKNYHSNHYPLRVMSWICSKLAKPHFRSRAPVRSFCSLSGLPH